MKRFFNLILGALAMLTVALLSAYLAMRITIHGREVVVPDLTGLTLADAGAKTSGLGLRINLQDRFYAPNVAAGHVIAQSPAAGSKVRREWAVRVTESLGPQQVDIPNLIGQTERPAAIAIRQRSLEVGVIAHLPAGGDAGIILAQTPTPDAQGIDRPRVSLLLSEPQDPAQGPAFVMPSLSGLTLAAASARTAAVGLHLVSAEDVAAPVPAAASTAVPTASPTTAATAAAGTAAASAPAAPAAVPTFTMSTVVAQSPPAGYRVVPGDAVKITLGH